MKTIDGDEVMSKFDAVIDKANELIDQGEKYSFGLLLKECREFSKAIFT